VHINTLANTLDRHSEITQEMPGGQGTLPSTAHQSKEGATLFKFALIIRCLAMAATAILQLWATTVVLHQLGTTQLALWTLIYQIVIFLSMLDIGLGQGISRMIADYEGGSPERSASFWGTIKSMAWMIGLVYACIMVASALYTPHFVAIPQIEVLPFTTALLIFAGWGLVRFRFALAGWTMYAKSDLVGAALFDFSLVVLRPLGVIVACRWIDGGMVTMALMVVASEAMVYLLSRFRAQPIAFGKAEAEIFWHILRFSGSMTIISLVGGSFFYLTGFLIGCYRTLQDVNIYQCSTMLGFLLMRLSFLPLQTAFPILVRAGRNSSLTENLRINRASILYFGFGVLISAMAVIAINHVFVSLWVGDDFYAGDMFTSFFILYIVFTIFQTSMKTALASITESQWQLAGFTMIEIALIIVIAPMILSHGLTFFPILMIIGHLIPTTLCIRQIRSRMQDGAHAV
jgi:O-antigen/teichoic acid export membrane protein